MGAPGACARPGVSTAAPMTARHFLAIDGPIGAGKTTLARLIQRTWGGATLLERFEENPFLALFYTDRQRYAWQTQLNFLVDRFDQLTEAPQSAGLLVSDYLFEKDLIFAQLNLDDLARRRHRKLFDALRRAVPQPSGVIFLQADLDTLLARIAARGRPYEQQMEPAYLDALRRAYEAFFATYTAAPLLRVDTSSLDFEHDPAAAAALLGQIQAAFGLPSPGSQS